MTVEFLPRAEEGEHRGKNSVHSTYSGRLRAAPRSVRSKATGSGLPAPGSAAVLSGFTLLLSGNPQSVIVQA